MKIIRQVESIADENKGSVIALGNFDGFHKGHQKVIGAAGRPTSCTDHFLMTLVKTIKITKGYHRPFILIGYGFNLSNNFHLIKLILL